MIIPTLAEDYKESMWTIYDVIRRSIDGTVPPLFVDYTNQRVLVGETAVVNTTAKLEVNGNIAIVGSTNGLILTGRGGGKYLLGVDTDGVLTCDRVG